MNPIALMVNAARRLETMFPGYFPGTKHNHARDFGWPEHLTFTQLYQMYLRNGIAHAGVEKTILKTWQDAPFLLDHERDGSEGADKKETPLELEIRQRFDDLRVWQHLAETDRRSLVGNYSGAILRLADSKRFQEPVDRVPGGLDGLVEIIPAWEGQLTVAEWDTDETSDAYGQPKMFQFNEAQLQKGNEVNKTRQFMLHPDRVLIWSKDGTVHGTSLLEAGYNDLIDLEKIKGAGGEGFWKNAKSAPVLQVDKETKLAEMAKAMGTTASDLGDKISDQVEDWQKGFDQLLMLQGMEAKTLGVTLPSPEHFWAAPLQSFAASIPIPLKILVGSQSGERASTEDANEWAQTNTSRRASQTIPNIMALVRRLERFGILPEKDWYLDWASLLDPSPTEKIDRAGKMAEINAKMQSSGEIVFTHEEIRAVGDYEPLSDAEKFRDDPDDERDAITPPGAVTEPEDEE